MNIKIKVNFEGKPEKDLNVVAYAFDHGGQFIAQGLLKDQQVQLSIKKNNVPTHILFGPPMAEDRSQPPSIEELERLHAYEPVWHFDPKKLEYELLQIPEFYWKLWRLCVCRVRGRVFKPVDFYGVIQELPVCHARVHICEVDPLLIVIPRLPDYIIDRIRGELLKPRWPIRFPFPLPDPPPFRFDPHVIDTSPINIAHMQPLRAAPSLEPLEATSEPIAFSESMRALQSLQTQENIDLPAAMRLQLSSESTNIVRQALLDNIVLLRPYLCYWPWIWPYFYRCDEVAVIYTDNNGRFDTTIYYPCLGDHPDLYFWVEYCIGGAWTAVYVQSCFKKQGADFPIMLPSLLNFMLAAALF